MNEISKKTLLSSFAPSFSSAAKQENPKSANSPYPDIRFLTPEEVAKETRMQSAYATYYLGLFCDDAACDWQPANFRLVGLHKTAAYILDVGPNEEAAPLTFPDADRLIAESYVCIAAQDSSQAQYWNNPNG